MKVQVQFPPQGIDARIVGLTTDGQEVELTGLRIEPQFFQPHATVPILYGRVEADLPGKPNAETHKFSLSLAGATGQVRMVNRLKPVKSRYEETGQLPPRQQKRPDKPSEKTTEKPN